MLVTVDRYNFEEEVLRSPHAVLVNFWSNWSEACKTMRRLMNELDLHSENRTRIREVNWDLECELARKYGVHGVPTLLIFCGGELVVRLSGTFNAEEFLNELSGNSGRNHNLRKLNRLFTPHSTHVHTN